MLNINFCNINIYSREAIAVDYLLGKTLTGVKVAIENWDSAILFELKDEKLLMFHSQECCESVMVKDICGNIDDLVGSPITMAEMVTKHTDKDFDSETWTFYKLATVKGYVTIAWQGESNGYYSEEVDFIKLKEGDFCAKI